MDIQLVDRDTARKAIVLVKAVEQKDRRLILELLMQSGEAGRTVTNIYTDAAFRNRAGGELDQSACSAHLAWLRRAGLVSTEKDGKHRIYKADATAIGALSRSIAIISEMAPETKKQPRRKVAA